MDSTEWDPRVTCRCREGVACVEVVARLAAADRSSVEGFDDVAAELRATARRWAVVHRGGQVRS